MYSKIFYTKPSPNLNQNRTKTQKAQCGLLLTLSKGNSRNKGLRYRTHKHEKKGPFQLSSSTKTGTNTVKIQEDKSKISLFFPTIVAQKNTNLINKRIVESLHCYRIYYINIISIMSVFKPIFISIASIAAVALLSLLPGAHCSPYVIADSRVRNLDITPVLGRGYSIMTNSYQSICLNVEETTVPSFNYDCKSIIVFQFLSMFLCLDLLLKT